MALFTSINTRFGETYTADDDNFGDFINDTSIPLAITNNEVVFTSNTHIQWDGDVGSVSDTDLICFNRAFRFGTDTNAQSERRLTGTSGTNAGKHAYFVNCTFYFDGAQRQLSSPNRRYPLLGGGATDWDVAREYAIPTDKSGNGTWNFYNCKFIYNMQYQNSDGVNTNTGILCGDFVDNNFQNINPESGEFVIYPQPGAIITGNTTDFVVHSSTSVAGGSIYQFDKTGPETFEDNSIQNYYIYPVEPAGLFEFPFLDATQTVLYTQGGAVPANPPVIRTQDFGSIFTNTSVLSSPRTNLQLNGNIYWRNSRNGLANNRPRVVASRRFERTAYTTPAQDTARNLVKYHFRGNVNYTTAGEAHTIAVNSTDIDREFITDTNGALTGTYNFIDGSSSASTEVKEHVDVPISYFRADTTQAVANTSDFYTEQFNFDTRMTAISLLGQTNYVTRYDSDNWAANDSEAAARDGFWIERDNVNEIDPSDEHMTDYSALSDITGLVASDGSSTLTPNEVYAIFKYAVWQQDRSDNKFVSIDNYPYDYVENGVFDMSTLPADGGGVDLELSSLSANVPYGIYNDEDFRIRLSGLEAAADGDTITKIKASAISLNRQQNTANLEANPIANGRAFSTLPSDFDTNYTAKDCTLGGVVYVDETGGNDSMVFNNVTWENGTVVRKAPGETAEVTAYLVGGTLPTDANDSEVFNSSVDNVLGVVDFTVNFSESVSAISAIDTAFIRSSDGSTFADATINSATLAADGMSAEFQVFYDASEGGSELYYAIVADQHRMVSGKTTTAVEVTLENFNKATVDDNYSPSGDDEVALRDNPFILTPLANDTDDIAINSAYTAGGISVGTNMSRYALRQAERSENWLEDVAKGYIPADYFNWREAAVLFDENNVDRIIVSHSSSDYIWDLRTRVEDANAVSYYSSLSTDISETYVQFAPTTNGASLTELIEQLELAVEDIKGVNDVDLSQAQTDVSTASLGIPVSEREAPDS